jgi:hypothetical protein
MILSPIATVDNTFLSPNTGIRSALTKSEIAAPRFFINHSEEEFLSDYDYLTNPSSSIMMNYYGLNHTRIKSLDPYLIKGEFTYENGITIIREEIVDKPFRSFGQIYKLHYNLIQKLDEQGFSKIYDCNSVFGFSRNNTITQET